MSAAVHAAPRAQLPADVACRVHALLRARLLQPFAWGLRDCAMLAFDTAHAITGQDPAHDLRGRYTTAMQAGRLLRRLGGLRGLVATRFGAPVPLHQARDGDVLRFASDVCTLALSGAGALGVRWHGANVGQGAQGLVVGPDAAVIGCWQVG